MNYQGGLPCVQHPLSSLRRSLSVRLCSFIRPYGLKERHRLPRETSQQERPPPPLPLSPLKGPQVNSRRTLGRPRTTSRLWTSTRPNRTLARSNRMYKV